MPYRLGRGRADRRRGHELDGDRDGDGGRGRRRDADAVGARLPRLRADRLPRRASCRSRSGCSGCPSLRRADPQWLAAFMALTAGLLSFLGVEALTEAFAAAGGAAGAARRPGPRAARRRAQLPRRSRSSSARTRAAAEPSSGARAGDARRGRHRPAQPRRGSRDRHVVRPRRATLGTFLIVGFMVHNVTEGLGIAAPLAEGGQVARSRCALAALAADRRRAGDPRRLDRRLRGATTCWRCCSSRSPRAPRSRSSSRSAATSRRAPGRPHVRLCGRRLSRRACGDVRRPGCSPPESTLGRQALAGRANASGQGMCEQRARKRPTHASHGGMSGASMNPRVSVSPGRCSEPSHNLLRFRAWTR